MEESYGIEAARAKLGDIADHARTTGQVTALTRHGHAIAVVGPAPAVPPTNGVEVVLFLGDRDDVRRFPSVPHTGDTILVAAEDGTETSYLVTSVQWDLIPDGEVSVNIMCDPVDETERLHDNHLPYPQRELARER
ncbi:type II toxin-antitoxin system Phd/YefM family antitoxin [Streptomyces sp. NRRL S-1868]|uniref:type II toxin-antitoxin system Phd/YefM family antitoxin n=1 Tax=Streptomyces sp. NRRL S-1868 TaxID=1463892 RepID=UPI0004C6CF13|nr:type II toxin-antitoxin system Phd/YefM family antitoxin [Streptomyces sp. NRRL S-1868]